MGKYDPLQKHLVRRRGREVQITFREIELLLGGLLLPSAAQQASWWTNALTQARGYIQCAAWLSAGYNATVSLAEQRVLFRRQQL